LTKEKWNSNAFRAFIYEASPNPAKAFMKLLDPVYQQLSNMKFAEVFRDENKASML